PETVDADADEPVADDAGETADAVAAEEEVATEDAVAAEDTGDPEAGDTAGGDADSDTLAADEDPAPVESPAD
ncbi:MAG: hypothetical protein OEV40_22680, partial [Acidimicrobiia bacterium]|nr:hypothetical protein [Acidimicrobiia bacterium]